MGSNGTLSQELRAISLVKPNPSLDGVLLFELDPTATGGGVHFIVAFPSELESIFGAMFDYFAIDLTGNQSELEVPKKMFICPQWD